MSYATAVDGRRYDIDPHLRAKYGAKSMPHECIPSEVVELNTVRDIVAGQLDTDRELLKLRYALDQIADDAPADPTELAVLDGEKRLDTIDGRIKGVLRRACAKCPSTGCPARMT